MTKSRYQQLIDELPVVRRIHLQGVGEPLLNKALPDMIELARIRGTSVGTSTNASLLSLARSNQLLDAGINRINVSLDTLDPDDFARSRPGCPLHKVLENVAGLARARSMGAYADVDLAFAVVAERSTIHDLPRIVQTAANLGFDEVYVQNLNGIFLSNAYISMQRLCHEDFVAYHEATASAQAIAHTLGIRFLAPCLDKPGRSTPCGWPFHGCNITWDGFVSPCCLQPDPEVLNFGNVFLTSFESIWQSTAYRQFRTEVMEGRAAVCADCPDLQGNMWHPLAAPL